MLLVSSGTYPTTGGLSSTDLISILAIVVVLFGLMLTAIGVLLLRQFNSVDSRVTEVKTEIQGDLSSLKADMQGDINTVRTDVLELRREVMTMQALVGGRRLADR